MNLNLEQHALWLRTAGSAGPSRKDLIEARV